MQPLRLQCRDWTAMDHPILALQPGKYSSESDAKADKRVIGWTLHFRNSHFLKSFYNTMYHNEMVCFRQQKNHTSTNHKHKFPMTICLEWSFLWALCMYIVLRSIKHIVFCFTNTCCKRRDHPAYSRRIRPKYPGFQKRCSSAPFFPPVARGNRENAKRKP